MAAFVLMVLLLAMASHSSKLFSLPISPFSLSFFFYQLKLASLSAYIMLCIVLFKKIFLPLFLHQRKVLEILKALISDFAKMGFYINPFCILFLHFFNFCFFLQNFSIFWIFLKKIKNFFFSLEFGLQVLHGAFARRV